MSQGLGSTGLDEVPLQAGQRQTGVTMWPRAEPRRVWWQGRSSCRTGSWPLMGRSAAAHLRFSRKGSTSTLWLRVDTGTNKDSKWPLREACDTWRHDMGAHLHHWPVDQPQEAEQGAGHSLLEAPEAMLWNKPDLFSCPSQWGGPAVLQRGRAVGWGCQRLTEGT